MSARDLPLEPSPWRDVDDAVLLRRAAQQAPGAVEELVARHGDRLCSFLARLLRDAAWAEDLTQETLWRALRQAAHYDSRWPLRTWLFTMARNLALDLLQKEQGRMVRDLGAREPSAVPPAVVTAEHREFQTALEQALQHLPEAFRSVFVLREGEGLGYEEIAAVLGIPVKTVSSRLHRARQLLRGRLGGHLQ